MSNSDGCVSSHSMSPQCHMHSSLSSAAPWRTDGCMAPIFTLEDKNTETEAGCLLLLSECKDEVSSEQEERSSSLVQVKPEPLQIKEEQEEELLQRPEEAAGSMLTSLAVKREDDDDGNKDTEPLASTSTEHMKTQADVEEFCGASQPTSEDQLLSSQCSESDITDDSDDWEETREDQDLNSSNKSPSMRTHIGKKGCSCTECGRVFDRVSALRRHMRTHTGEKPLLQTCTVCNRDYASISSLNAHMRIHTGEKVFNCTECGKVFVSMSSLKVHMRVHTGEKSFCCTECGKAYRHMSSLKQHMFSTNHSGGKVFSCTLCDHVFSGTCELRQHLMTHTSFKPSATVTS